MRHVLFVALVACWSSSTTTPPATPAPAAPPPSSTGGATYASAGMPGMGEGSGEPVQFGSGNKPIPKCSELQGPGLCADDRPAGEHGHGRVIGRGSGAPTPPTLEKIAIRNAIKQHIAAIQACYETQLATKPDLAGTVTASFTIEPDGQVSNATASGVDPDVAMCVAAEVKTIQFPTATSKTVVNYPFMFRPAT